MKDNTRITIIDDKITRVELRNCCDGVCTHEKSCMKDNPDLIGFDKPVDEELRSFPVLDAKDKD